MGSREQKSLSRMFIQNFLLVQFTPFKSQSINDSLSPFPHQKISGGNKASPKLLSSSIAGRREKNPNKQKTPKIPTVNYVLA